MPAFSVLDKTARNTLYINAALDQLAQWRLRHPHWGHCAALATGLRTHQSPGTICFLGSRFCRAGPTSIPSQSGRCSGGYRL